MERSHSNKKGACSHGACWASYCIISLHFRLRFLPPWLFQSSCAVMIRYILLPCLNLFMAIYPWQLYLKKLVLLFDVGLNDVRPFNCPVLGCEHSCCMIRELTASLTTAFAARLLSFCYLLPSRSYSLLQPSLYTIRDQLWFCFDNEKWFVLKMYCLWLLVLMGWWLYPGCDRQAAVNCQVLLCNFCHIKHVRQSS